MPGSPYADLDRPPLREPVLRRLVVPGGLWTDLWVVPETGSTNADVVAAGRAGAAEGLVLIAERQTAGRGRLDRSWQVPERAGITISVLLRPTGTTPAQWGWLPLLTGVAVVDAIGSVAEVDAALKWPNDLLVRPPGSTREYGKCAGILAEAVVGEYPGVVVGIGLNVSQRADELPEPGDPRAYRPTSLALAEAANTDRLTLVRAVLRALERWYLRWQAAGGDADACGLRAAYSEHCVTIGQDLRVALPDGTEITGRGTGVDADGRLLVSGPGGEHVLAAGDVRHVR
jgi:BirA family transcriptional regulator, biotin operon repressor / biotin---[acetyl-CoA-carboxylase] ligase